MYYIIYSYIYIYLATLWKKSCLAPLWNPADAHVVDV